MGDLHRQLQLSLEGIELAATARQASTPSGYRGLYTFHKYWGKKPYESSYIRPPRFFTNSRINATRDLTLKNLFTGRALRNIDLLLEAIESLPLSYSAGSVVQDSRRGSLKHDLALVFQKTNAAPTISNQLYKLQGIEGWSDALPGKQEKF